MARVTKKEGLQLLAQAEQTPSLFDEENIPVRPDLLVQVERRVYEHTGVRLLDNERECLRLVEKLMAGISLRQIARELNVSRKTIRAARRELERQGKLAPYKQRVVQKFEDIVEAGAEQYLEAMEKGLVPAAQIPVGLGIIFDKRAAALGEPTTIVGVAADPAKARTLSVEALNAWVDSLPHVNVIDTPSDVPPSTTEGKP